MPDPQERQLGEGQDNFGEAARQLSSAARQAQGAEAVGHSAAAAVKAGAEGGKAVSEVAAGTAAGGPWGAILSAAWSLRHTLFKLLVCVCLFLLILIVLIVSLPSVVSNSIFGLDGEPGASGTTLLSSFTEMSGAVTDAIERGHELSLARVDEIIADDGYDYDLSHEALVDYAQSSAGFDVCYVLAAYSASLEQRGTSKSDMLSKLDRVAENMFPVSYEEKQQERTVPATYYTYKPTTVTVVTSQKLNGIVNGVPRYTYETETRTYYLPDQELSAGEAVTVANYAEVSVTVPVYSGGKITGARTAAYYQPDGERTVSPTTELVRYAACTIRPFDNTVITDAFQIDTGATYNQFTITYGEAIQNMANALKMTMYGTLGYGEMVPLTDAELIAFMNMQNCSATRKYILSTALSLVGKVPYFWGGKSAAGWDDAWNTPRLVTAAGSPSSGTIRPYGLDCSGFATWVFDTCFGVNIGAGCNNQYTHTYGISASELLPGDLGFYRDGSDWGHILIFAGYDASGQRMWVHSTNGGGCNGVVLNHPSYEGTLSYRRLSIIDYDAPVLTTATTTTN